MHKDSWKKYAKLGSGQDVGKKTQRGSCWKKSFLTHPLSLMVHPLGRQKADIPRPTDQKKVCTIG